MNQKCNISSELFDSVNTPPYLCKNIPQPIRHCPSQKTHAPHAAEHNHSDYNNYNYVISYIFQLYSVLSYMILNVVVVVVSWMSFTRRWVLLCLYTYMHVRMSYVSVCRSTVCLMSTEEKAKTTAMLTCNRSYGTCRANKWWFARKTFRVVEFHRHRSEYKPATHENEMN